VRLRCRSFLAARVLELIGRTSSAAADRRLLRHLEVLEIRAKPGVPARERLEATVGAELAEILVRMLTGRDQDLARTA
jgi:hypothetical protein